MPDEQTLQATMTSLRGGYLIEAWQDVEEYDDNMGADPTLTAWIPYAGSYLGAEDLMSRLSDSILDGPTDLALELWVLTEITESGELLLLEFAHPEEE